MENESMKVLELLAAGKITVDDANRLLEALRDEPAEAGDATRAEVAPSATADSVAPSPVTTAPSVIGVGWSGGSPSPAGPPGGSAPGSLPPHGPGPEGGLAASAR